MRTDSYGSRTPAGATRGAGRSSPISAKRSSIKLIARASHAPVYGATQIAGERYGLQVVTWEGRASEAPDAWARRHAGEDSETSTKRFGHARARGPAFPTGPDHRSRCRGCRLHPSRRSTMAPRAGQLGP